MISITKTQGDFNFSKVRRKIAAQRMAIKTEMGTKAMNHFKGNFRAQGFVDVGIDPWKARKAQDKKNKKIRAILVKRGILLRSIGIIGTPGERVIVGTRGIKYAKRHNEGLAGMPQRKFIGRSTKLEMNIREAIIKRINRIWASS